MLCRVGPVTEGLRQVHQGLGHPDTLSRNNDFLARGRSVNGVGVQTRA